MDEESKRAVRVTICVVQCSRLCALLLLAGKDKSKLKHAQTSRLCKYRIPHWYDRGRKIEIHDAPESTQQGFSMLHHLGRRKDRMTTLTPTGGMGYSIETTETQRVLKQVETRCRSKDNSILSYAICDTVHTLQAFKEVGSDSTEQ